MDASEIVERFFTDVWNRRDFSVLEDIVAKSCVTHQIRSAPEPISTAPRGPAALRKHIEAWLTAFPDIQVTTDLRCTCGGDVVSWVTREAHTGRPGRALRRLDAK